MNQPVDTLKTNKLIIRIKVAPDEDATNASSSTDDNPPFLPWLIIAIVIAVLIGGGYWYSNQAVSVDESPASVAKIELKHNSNDSKVFNQALVQNDLSTVVTDDASEIVSVAPIEITEQKSRLIQKDDMLQAVAENPPVSPLQESLIAELPAVKTPEHETEVAESATANQAESRSGDLAMDAPIISDSVARALFALDIKNREPVDEIKQKIDAKSEGLKRVYFFSELRGLKGKKIIHRWIHKGKQQSEVLFQVNGNRWRINSSKRIVPAQTGEWRVDIVDTITGQILASKTFIYGNE